MQVHRLRLVNFRQHEETDLFFDLGLTGVIGPNGSGKTTLLEALAWAIYGTKAARGTADSIRRRNAPPRARVEVELDFTLGAHRYRVVRTLHGAELYQDGDPSPIANSSSSVTERLGRILGMTREEFFNTYFTGQKELAIMGSMTPSEREKFLSRVLGYERLAVAQKRLAADRSVLRAQLQTIEASLVSPAELAEEETAVAARLAQATETAVRVRLLLDEADATLTALRPEWEAAQRLQEQVRSLESDLRVAEQQVVAGRDAFTQLDRDLAEAVQARGRLDELAAHLAPLAELVEERARLDGLAAQLAKRREAVGQIGEVRRRLDAIDRRLQSLPAVEAVGKLRTDLAAARAGLESADRVVQEKHTEWVRDLQEAQTKRQQLLDQYQDLKTQQESLVAAGPDGVCPTCGRPLGTEFQEVLDELNRQLEEVTFNGNYFRQRLEQLKAEPRDVRDRRADRDRLKSVVDRLTEDLGRHESLQQTRATLTTEREGHVQRLALLEASVAEVAEGYDEHRHKEVVEALGRLEPMRLEAGRLGALAERAPRLTAEAAASETELSRREARVKSLAGQLAELGWSVERFETLRARLAAAERARQEAEVAVVRADAEGTAADTAVRAAARRREERDKRAAEAQRIGQGLMLNQELDRAFSDLRGDLNDTLRPDLSDLGSRFLRDLTVGRYTEFELDEDYVPTIVEDGEPQAVLSGGEEDVVSLALRLAISQMIAERAGQPLSLLVLDEIFGSLDEERRNAVVDLLRRLADRFPQVILITHIDTVRDGFDRVLRLTYDVERGVARVREESVEGHHAAA
jgi:exonuclease SbcC